MSGWLLRVSAGLRGARDHTGARGRLGFGSARSRSKTPRLGPAKNLTTEERLTSRKQADESLQSLPSRSDGRSAIGLIRSGLCGDGGPTGSAARRARWVMLQAQMADPNALASATTAELVGPLEPPQLAACAPGQPRTDVVAVIPAYQCAETVAAVVAGVRKVLAAVVVVDDGSSDETAAAARAAGAAVEVLPENRGKGFALRRGIELALTLEPRALALLDADGQHSPEDLPALLAVWDRNEADMVIGARLAKGSEVIPRARYWTNYIGSRILSWMSGRELEDSQSGYRLLSAALIGRLGLVSNGYAIESEMLLKAAARGARIAHAPIRVIYDGAESHFRPVMDTVRISLAAIRTKVFDDG